VVDRRARGSEGLLERAQRDLLLLLVPLDALRNAAEVRLERLRLRDQLEPVGVERRGHVGLQRAELLPFPVVGNDCELRLRGSQWNLFALPRDARGEDAILELVVLLRELGREQPSLARLAQAVEPLELVVVGRLLLALAQRGQLRSREEILVARDDRRLLGGLLLPHAHGTSLLGALVEVLLQTLLVLGRATDGLGHIHRIPTPREIYKAV